MKLAKVHAVALRFMLAIESALLNDDWESIRTHALQLAAFADNHAKKKN
jgi:hypothetical protein